MTQMMAAVLGISLVVFGSVGCEQATPTSPSASGAPQASALLSHGEHNHSHGAAAGAALGPDVLEGIAQLRRKMAPFHNFDKAVEAGYDTPAPGPGVCISDPVRGGMGYHFTKSSKNLIDGEVNLLEPEFIVYSPTKNGGMRLSAADYFVPYDFVPRDADPPTLLGVPFAQEDAFGAWVLHIWAFWPNPAGIFENFNPDVPPCP
jgi:hypothetical protein